MRNAVSRTGSAFTPMEPILHLSLPGKATLLDPSGNVIEIKSYADLAAGLQAI